MHDRFVILVFLLYSLSASAFDNDYSINRPNLYVENFLDINSVQFNEDLNEQWYRSNNGWRITGHSLTADLLQTDSEIKLMNTLSDSVNIYFNFKQEVFYADKPLKDPLLEIEIIPLDTALSFSFISTLDYKKAESDMGFALTLGQRSADYIRIQELIVDRLFNEKNKDEVIDQASYSDYQYILSIDAVYQWARQFEIRMDIKDLSEMTFNFDDQISRFTHGGYEYDTSFKYTLNPDNAWKLALKGFKTDKSLATTGSHQIQQLQYDSIDLNWITQRSRPYRFSLGMRDDKLKNHIRDAIYTGNNLDYSIRTTQVYSTVQHSYKAHQAWNIGIYLGLTRIPNDFNLADPSANAHTYQGQLRASWILSSKDDKSNLQLHFNLNLDRLGSDPGDGAGMSYQAVF